MTRVEIENYIAYVQNELATDVLNYITKLSIKGNFKDSDMTMVMIAHEIIYDYNPDEINCITEAQFCSIVAYIQNIIRK